MANSEKEKMAAGPTPQKEVYVVELFKGCKSGRLMKLTEPIDLDPSQIMSQALSTNIRNVVRDCLGIE